MVAEMMVALMAMIAACVLEPGEYFAINTKGTPTEVVAKVSAAGFPVTEKAMESLATNLGESTMFNRAGGAPTFAVGMAHMFGTSFRQADRVGAVVSLRHHVRSAIHFDND